VRNLRTLAARLRQSITRTKTALLARTDHGMGFWFMTLFLGLVLPTPVAVVVIAARIRRAYPRKLSRAVVLVASSGR